MKVKTRGLQCGEGDGEGLVGRMDDRGRGREGKALPTPTVHRLDSASIQPHPRSTILLVPWSKTFFLLQFGPL